MSNGSKGGGGASMAAAIWLFGWLFTWAFAHLVWWKVILGIIIWPYYLGAAL